MHPTAGRASLMLREGGECKQRDDGKPWYWSIQENVSSERKSPGKGSGSAGECGMSRARMANAMGDHSEGAVLLIVPSESEIR
jgi:hypothetical protein